MRWTLDTRTTMDMVGGARACAGEEENGAGERGWTTRVRPGRRDGLIDGGEVSDGRRVHPAGYGAGGWLPRPLSVQGKRMSGGRWAGPFPAHMGLVYCRLGHVHFLYCFSYFCYYFVLFTNVGFIFIIALGIFAIFWTLLFCFNSVESFLFIYFSLYCFIFSPILPKFKKEHKSCTKIGITNNTSDTRV